MSEGLIAGAIVVVIIGLVALGVARLHAHDEDEERRYHSPENCRPYAEEPRSGGASCPRRSQRARIEKLPNGGALLVCECPGQSVEVH